MKKLIVVVVLMAVAVVVYFAVTGKQPPTPTLAAAGKVASVTGAVKVTRPDGSTVAAKVDTPVGPGDKVTTDATSRCAVEFEDGSAASLSPKSDVTVAKLDKQVTARMMNIELKLDAGKILMDVPQGPTRKTTAQVTAPSGTIGVRGTKFAGELDPSKSLLVAVFEGKVDVSAQGQTVSLSADQATLVKMGSAPAKPVQMLSAPGLTAPASQAKITTQDIPVTFAQVEGAKRYLVELAKNPQFTHIVAEVFSDATTVSVPGPATVGPYYVRVSAVNDLGLQGKLSEVRMVSYVFTR